AMELVAAANMRKTVQKTIQSRTYAQQTEGLLGEVLERLVKPKNVCLTGHVRPDAHKKRTLVLVAASDRGLCGAFNQRVLKQAVSRMPELAEDVVEILTVGHQAETTLRRLGYTLTASYGAISNGPSAVRVAPIVKQVFEAFNNGTYDRVFLAYTHFRSVLVQEPCWIPLLPFGETPTAPLSREQEKEGELAVFEPSLERVLEQLLPRVFQVRLYQALLESAASEHAARMMAMKNARESANDVLDGLTLMLNRARQGAITQEISEISAGKAALA
nr:ATP synthase F1 subunit gamma [Patescibacteria group bacterium]